MKALCQTNFKLFLIAVLFSFFAFFTTSAHADFSDFLNFAASYGKTAQDTGFNTSFDFDTNGIIDISDLEIYASSNSTEGSSIDDEDEENSASNTEKQVPGDLDGDGKITMRDINIKNFMLQIINFQNFIYQLASNLSLQNNYYFPSNITPTSQPIAYENFLDFGHTIAATITNIENTPTNVQQKIPYDKIYTDIIHLSELNSFENKIIYNDFRKLTSLQLYDHAGVLKQAIIVDQNGNVSGNQKFYYNHNNTLSRVDTYNNDGMKISSTLYNDNGKVKTETYDNKSTVIAITYYNDVLQLKTKDDAATVSIPEKSTVELKKVKQEQAFLSDSVPIKTSADTPAISRGLAPDHNKLIDYEKYR